MEKTSKQNKPSLEIENPADSFFHQPVLLKEVEELLNIKKGEWYLDATVGGGGHAKAIIAKGGHILGLDWDKEAIKFAAKKLASFSPNGEVCPTPPFLENGGGKNQSRPKDWLLVPESFANQLRRFLKTAGERTRGGPIKTGFLSKKALLTLRPWLISLA